jgi:ATP-dependent exoDNAse (exonuclease V) beta subunit
VGDQVARERPEDAFGPVEPDQTAPTRMAVTEWLNDAPAEGQEATGAAAGEAAAGILVHRLLQFPPLPDVSGEAQASHARRLLRPEERAGLKDLDSTVGAALAAWQALYQREDVGALLSDGCREHEVPFSMQTVRNGAPVILRGTIDCLVHRQDGSIVVLEFKTGRRRLVHQLQLDAYVDAVRALFPGATVEGRLVYSDSVSSV